MAIWKKVTYTVNGRDYNKYEYGNCTLKRTHSKNMFTGKEMSPQYQVWEIFIGGKKVDYRQSIKDAKKFAEEYLEEQKE